VWHFVTHRSVAENSTLPWLACASAKVRWLKPKRSLSPSGGGGRFCPKSDSVRHRDNCSLASTVPRQIFGVPQKRFPMMDATRVLEISPLVAFLGLLTPRSQLSANRIAGMAWRGSLAGKDRCGAAVRQSQLPELRVVSASGF
jgi:hypothetical protein